MKRGVLLAAGAALTSGLTTPLVALLTASLGTYVLAAALYLGAAVLLLVRRGGLVRGELPWLGASALVGGVLGPVLLVSGLRDVDAATASLLLASQPVLTAGIAWFVVREHASARTVAGMLAIAGGSVLLAWQGSPHGSLGALLVLAAAAAWAVDDNIARSLEGSDALTVAGAKGALAGCVSLAIAVAVREPAPALAPFAAALAVGLIGYGVSVAWFVAAQRDLGTARTAAYFGAAPLIGAAAALAFGARPNVVTFVIAAAFIAVGIALHAFERHLHSHRHDPLLHVHEHDHDAHHHHVHDGAVAAEPHVHPHEHVPIVHAHAHAPDLHHRHTHDDGVEHTH